MLKSRYKSSEDFDSVSFSQHKCPVSVASESGSSDWWGTRHRGLCVVNDHSSKIARYSDFKGGKYVFCQCFKKPRPSFTKRNITCGILKRAILTTHQKRAEPIYTKNTPQKCWLCSRGENGQQIIRPHSNLFTCQTSGVVFWPDSLWSFANKPKGREGQIFYS